MVLGTPPEIANEPMMAGHCGSVQGGSVQGNGDKPLVSVVIPCYNHGRFLSEAIESVLRQEYRPFEIVVIDDGSTDHTAQVAARYPSVQYCYQTNAGLAAARNTGISKSRGSYILFLDADDLLCAGALGSAVDVILENPGCGFVYGDFRVIDKNGAALDTFDRPSDHRDDYLGLFEGNHIAMCATVLYPRHVLEQVGEFRAEFRAAEDYDLYFRIARLFPYKRHGAVMAEYRRHDDNMSVDAALMLRSTLSVVRAQREHVVAEVSHRRAYLQAIRIWRDYYGGLLVRQIRIRFRQGKVYEGMRDSWTLLKTAPKVFLSSISHAAGRAIRKILRSPRFLRSRRLLNAPPFRKLEPASRDFGYDRGTPIDRYYIEAALAAHATDIHGHVLEIKDRAYTQRFGGARVTKSDVLDIISDNPQATLVADLTDAPQIPSDTFDCILITQTLHIIYDLPAAIRTLHRILKPGGLVLATVPGISRIVRDGENRWQDHWRFTTASAHRLFQDVFADSKIEIQASGNLCAAVNFLDGRAVEELRPSELEHLDPDYELVIFIRAVKT
jgi:glycosyltransferase involved in cell wall biosynthesis